MNSYWQNRLQAEQEGLVKVKEQKLLRKLAKEYQRLQREVIRDMENIYMKIIQEQASGEVLVSHLYAFTNYYSQLAQIQQQLIQMGSKDIELIDKSFTELYKANGNLVSKQFNLPFDPTTETVQNAVHKIWCNDKLTWSDRVWKNSNNLLNRINATVVDAVARGVNPDKLTENLMLDFGVSFHNASRIVRTELTYVMNQSTADAAKDAGCEKYQILEEQAGACDVCSELNGQTFYFKDMKVGVNCPPMHPNCRGTILPIVD